MNGQIALGASSSGTLAYRPAPETRQFVWADRNGIQTGAVTEPDRSQALFNSVSTDGRTVAVRRTINGNTDVWLLDVGRGTFRRATVNPAVDGNAVLSPSGNRIYYSSDPHGTLWDVYVKDVDGGMEMPLSVHAENEYSYDVSPDERYLLFSGAAGDSARDIWALPLFGDRKAFAVVTGPAYESGGRFAPDGRWILFRSDESGRMELYAQAFPQNASRVQISRGGTDDGPVQWTSSGEVIYSTSAGKVVAVPIAQNGATLAVGRQRELFSKGPGDVYIPMPDGTRFLVNRWVAAAPPMEIVLNWKPPKR
jgi:Tol biopolymer transport system component